MGEPGVTVVMITRDRCGEALDAVGRLVALPERPPVVVVDNGSADRTAPRLRAAFPQVRVVALGTNLGGAGRNIGVALSATPYVAFCDDDTWWSEGSLGRAVALLRAHPRLAVVTARILVEPAGDVDAISVEMGDSPLTPPAGLPGAALLSFLAGASVVRRRAFVGAGGFSDRLLIGGEEELLSMDLTDAGWAMAYVEDVEIHHRASTARDAHLRRRQGIRNTLWTTWLRRPAPSAWQRTARLLPTLPRDHRSALAVVEALRGAGWVAAGRRPVAADIDAGLRLLEAGQLRSTARRYVS